MNALSRNKNLQIELVKIPEPHISTPNDVQVEIKYATFCRDDMKISDKLGIFNDVGVIGHEACGVISESGVYARENGFEIGDRVMIYPIHSCCKCKECLKQRPQYCSEAGLSIGVFSEFIVRDFHQLVKIPSFLSFKQASVMEPVADVLEALSKIKYDFFSNILIIGGGFCGLTFLKTLKAGGVKNIVVVEPIEARQTLATSFGATVALSTSDNNFQMNLMKHTNFNGFDIVIDTTANSQTINLVLPSMAANSTLLMFAYQNSTDIISFNSLNMYKNNIRVVWSCLCGLEQIRNSAEIIHELSLARLITKEYPFKDSVEAYNKYLTYDEIKIGVNFD
ncbi:MAG: alcohol dehydrogenase catalytic domain-containing protein [Clostridia bacterium]